MVSERTFDEAVDDYLRVIVRTRPWTKLLEEEALQAFAGWRQHCRLGQHVQIDPLRREAAAWLASLPPAQRSAYGENLERFLHWIVHTH